MGAPLERHILKMKKVYRKRREALIAALETHFSGQVHVYGDAAGLHLVAGFGRRALNEQTFTDIEEAGARLYPVEQHAIQKGKHQGEVILGYGNLTPEEIEEGVRRIQTVLAPAEEQATGLYRAG